jgi:type I restriction enzyme, S subunit
MNNWTENLLSNHVSLITKGTTPTSLGKSFKESGINFIKAESITEAGEFILDSFAYIDEETHELLKRSQLHDGDILFSIAGVLGRIAIVNSSILPAIQIKLLH